MDIQCPHCQAKIALSDHNTISICPSCTKKINISVEATVVNSEEEEVAPGTQHRDTDSTQIEQAEKKVTQKRPQVIGGYALMNLLGKGGMASVYKVRQLSLNRECAMKILPKNLASQEEFIQRFNREAETLAKLLHPNIIQVIDRGVHNGELYYFVMELVDGKGLDEILKEEFLLLEEKLRIIIDVCKGLNYAHNREVVHRDIKPSNIMVSKDGDVKIADFGIAGIVGGQGDEGLTMTGVGMGTLRYMAPEQKQNAKYVDQRADIYALGVMIYEMITGEFPLGRFPMPSELDKEIDTRLDIIVDKSLQLDPKKRF